MPLSKTKKKIPVQTLIVFFAVTSSMPASASLFPFRSDKKIIQSQYSKNEDQINALNEQAVELFEQGLFEEAQQLWEQAIQMMEGPEKLAEQQRGKQSNKELDDDAFVAPGEEGGLGGGEIEALYESAVSLFKKQNYVSSKKMFERVEASVPDYKATRNYLTILDHKIKGAQQTLSGDKFKSDALIRREERAEWRRILHESEKELKKKMDDQASPIYQQAIEYYTSRKFTIAKDYFSEVNAIAPGYKDTAQYLARIDDDIRREEQRLVEEKRKQEILARKKEQEEWRRVLQESKQQLQMKLTQEAEPIYQEALRYYRERQFESAKISFQDVEWIIPDYKSTARYLERIDQDIREEARLRQERRAQELERQNREAELARRREEARLEGLRVLEEEKRRQDFQEEIAARRKEREEWLKILTESERERRNKLREHADFVYREAIQLYKGRQFEQARDDFLEVEHIVPGYKSTAKYLARIDQDIEEEEKQRLEQRQRVFRRNAEEEEMVRRREKEKEQQLRLTEEQDRLREFKAKALARQKKREEWERMLKESGQERQKKLEEEAEFIYQEALRSYKTQQWERARSGFLETEKILPGYKQAGVYLEHIDQDIENGERQRRATIRETVRRRKQEETLMRGKEEERQAKMRMDEEKERTLQKQERAKAVYTYALSLYKKGDYIRAKDKFMELERILPGYKATSKYLRRIDGDIAKAWKSHRGDQQIDFERQVGVPRAAQKRAQERLERLVEAEEKRRVKKLSEEALDRQKERKAWEETVKQIEMKYQKRLQQQTESIYQEALRYYKAGWFEQAKKSFEEVEAAIPGYKSTAKYLTLVVGDMDKEELVRKENEEQVQRYAQKGRRHPKPLRAETAGRQNKKEKLAKKRAAEQRFVERKQGQAGKNSEHLELEKNGDLVVEKAVAQRQKTLAQETEKKYLEALRLYKARNFVEAKLKFIEVESLSPGYKTTLKYLKGIDEKIAHQQKKPQHQTQVVSGGRKGLTGGTGHERGDARRDIVSQALAQEEKRSWQRGGPDISVPVRGKKQLSRGQKGKKVMRDGDHSVRDRREELKEQRRIVQREYEQQFKRLYDKAIKLYRSSSYEEARNLFLRIEQMKPGYKGAASYLKKAEARVPKERQKPGRDVVLQPKAKTRTDIVAEILDALEQRL